VIKIKLTNWNVGRNNHTFRPFLMYANVFTEIGVEFVQDGSFDYEFVGMVDFLNKSVPLDESISVGLENLSNKEGDYYLFDGSDSTSLMAAYEVLEKSNAKALYKNQLLKREEYKTPSAFNKWFFGNGSDLDLSYDISEDDYQNRLRLSGWNLGYYNPQYLNFDVSNLNRDIDVCAIYQGYHKENYDHNVRNDIMYTNHRVGAWDVIDDKKHIVYKDKRPYNEYVNVLRRSKMTLSPFGMGEVCFRDFEIIQFGSVMIKPDMGNVVTKPNVYIPYETYIPCNYDWSNLNEVIDDIVTNWNKYKDIADNARKVFKEQYSIQNLVLHWYDELKTYNGVV
jgi:hypothetical protein